MQRYEKGHLNEVVALHETCFTKRDNFAMCLGHDVIYRTYQFFLDDSKSFGFVAICGGQVVGVLVGRLDYYTSALNKYRVGAAIRGMIYNPSLMFSRRVMFKVANTVIQGISRKDYKKQLESAPSHQEGRTATLASLCVHPDYRKFKIGEGLLSRVEECCRQNNMRYLRAGMQRSNVASRFTYRSRGYIEDEVLSGDDDLFYYLPL